MSRALALFPLFALLGVGVAIAAPQWLVGLKPAIVPLLGVVMLGMGITLSGDDFTRVIRRPWVILLGLLLQFGVMPLAGWLLGLAGNMSPALLAGFVLLGASPGGTASNVICYLARGDVALSITLTTASTLLAVLLTPALTWLYVGERVDVPALEMLVSIAEIILAPVILGVLLNRFFGARLGALKALFPLVSMGAIVLIIAIIVALNRANLASVGALVMIAVMLHNGIGLASGYWIARLLRQDERCARTLAIEVGMQNSGLAVALAVKYFSAAAALPGALFSIWHNLSGAALASWWARRR
jgi:bile acid:Na+ symporter, BASS family